MVICARCDTVPADQQDASVVSLGFVLELGSGVYLFLDRGATGGEGTYGSAVFVRVRKAEVNL